MIHAYRFATSDELIRHLQEVHNQVINIDKRSFSNMEEFMIWKADFEEVLPQLLFYILLQRSALTICATTIIVITLVPSTQEVKEKISKTSRQLENWKSLHSLYQSMEIFIRGLKCVIIICTKHS